MSSTVQKEAIRHLRALRRWGFAALPVAKGGAAGVSAPAEAAGRTPPPQVEPPTAPEPLARVVEPPPPAAGEGAAALAAIAAEVAQCRKCRLCETRSRTVPGEGSPQAKIVFVGEAPGFHEDRKGRPFVGDAGDLLTKMIVAMRFRREDVFICNVIKCRPPDNRNPAPDEIAACEGYLLRQLEALSPKIIVTLGKFATQCLLNTTAPISRLRGKWAEYHGIAVMPTFHPAYLLRNPADKKNCWDDLQKVMAEYERSVGAPPAASGQGLVAGC